MTVLLPALATAFAAFCLWLAVRIINRRGRWAKWVLGVVVGLPVLYVASFGPACWTSAHVQPSGDLVSCTYRPLLNLGSSGPDWLRPIMGFDEGLSTDFHGFTQITGYGSEH